MPMSSISHFRSGPLYSSAVLNRSLPASEKSCGICMIMNINANALSTLRRRQEQDVHFQVWVFLQGTAGSHQAQMVSGLHLQRPQQGHSAPPQGNVNMSSPNAEALMAYLQQAQGMSSLVGRPQQPAPQLQGQAPQARGTADPLMPPSAHPPFQNASAPILLQNGRNFIAVPASAWQG